MTSLPLKHIYSFHFIMKYTTSCRDRSVRRDEYADEKYYEVKHTASAKA